MNRNQRRLDKKQAAPAPIPAQAQALFGQATQQHQAGRLDEAEAAYRQVLALAPRHADALYLLGVLHHQTGRPEEAEELLGRSITARGDAAHVHAALGTVLLTLGRPADAAAALKRSLALKPDQAEAHNNLGNALKELGRLEEAVPHYQRAITLKPDYANAHNGLGSAHMAQGRYQEATSHYRRALALNPRLVVAHVNLGKALRQLGDLAGAEAQLRQGLALDATNADALNNLGAVYQALGRADEATACLRQAVTLAPDDADAQLNLSRLLAGDILMRDPGLLRQALGHAERALTLRPGHAADTLDALGSILQRLGRLDDAAARYREAMALAPDDAEIAYNLGTTMQALCRWQEASTLYGRALALNPNHADARFTLGLIQLAEGNLAEGWAGYDTRWRSRQLAPHWRPFPAPLWRGESLAGKRLLVWGEQGLGDEIMFGSLLPTLGARVAAEGGQLVVECESRLTGLFARALPDAVVRSHTSGPGAPTPSDMDLHLPMGSLPPLLLPRLGDWTGGPFLTARPELSALWRERLAGLGDGVRVGICWRSGIQRGDRAGAYTALADWRALLTLPGVIPVTLQYSAPEEEIRLVEEAAGVTVHRWPDLDLRADIEGLAGLMTGLDLVISAPTAVGELAGALGVPCWRVGTNTDWSALGTGVRPWFNSMSIMSVTGAAPTAADCVALATRRLYALTRRQEDHLLPCPAPHFPI